MVLHGKGNQAFLTKEYEKDRQRALEDRTRYSEEDLDYLEITPGQGCGATNYRKFQVWQWPFPTNTSVRSRKKIDTRKRPQTGWD
jgi:hypothetical protein